MKPDTKVDEYIFYLTISLVALFIVIILMLVAIFTSHVIGGII